MSTFDEYARYYDLLYRDKDYHGETATIDKLIKGYAPSARTVLNLGCGSGKHDRCLAALGYRVTGVDLSEEMLVLARKEAANSESLEYCRGDVCSVRLGKTFDVVVSLFHVMSYQVSNENLLAALETARLHLSPGGVFIFDCWYGPGVLTDRPAVRVKELEDESIKVTRIAKPVMHPNDNVVDVNYHILIQDKLTSTVREVDELHRMRYLFLPEISLLLGRMGMKILDAHESFKPDTAGSFAAWSLTVVAQCCDSSIWDDNHES